MIASAVFRTSSTFTFFCGLTLFMAPQIWAAPEIHSLSGELENGHQITISGPSFGTGPSVALFDDFEKGTLGEPMLIGPNSAQVGQWDTKDASLGIAVYGNVAVSGSLSYESDKSHWSMHQIRYFPPGTNKVFMSYYVRMDESYGTESWKLAWLFDWDEKGDQEDDIAIPVRTQGGGWIIDGNANTELPPYGSFYPSSSFHAPLNTWGRISFYCELKTSHSGKLRVWDRHPTEGIRLLANTDTFQVAGSTQGNAEWDKVHIPGLTPNGAGYLRHDDIYIATGDHAMARIEIGNAPVYTNSTKFGLAVPTLWEEGRIQATVYQGEFQKGDQVYLFIFNSSGEVSTGYGPLIYGKSMEAVIPPNNLRLMVDHQ